MKTRELSITGLVLRKVNFRETSVILDLLTAELGKISLIAKGARQNKSKFSGCFDLLNLVEFELYKKPQSDWYLVQSASVLHTHLYEISFQQNILMQAAAEIIRQLHIPHEDQSEIFQLMEYYLDYIPKISGNGIAIFWRFMLRLLTILGINLELNRCVICGEKKSEFSAFSIKFHGLICSNCFRPSLALPFSKPKEVSSLFNQINSIGNLLEQLEISPLTIKQINQIFLDHLQEHFHKSFSLKTLTLYK
ncbi:MAG: DNA repair protein RecO [Candidatus Cloacimonadales bacterium]